MIMPKRKKRQNGSEKQETDTFFLEGDIVAVKLDGGIWWPSFIISATPLKCSFWEEKIEMKISVSKVKLFAKAKSLLDSSRDTSAKLLDVGLDEDTPPDVYDWIEEPEVQMPEDEPIKKRKKPNSATTRVKWTDKEKEEVEKIFKENIDSGITPGVDQCTRAVQSNEKQLCSEIVAGTVNVANGPDLLRMWLRQHPKVMNMKFREGVKRAERNNAIDQYVLGTVGTDQDKESWDSMFENPPAPLTQEERHNWILQLKGVCLSSDAFFPFRDNIDRAALSGVEYIVSPAGSTNDDGVVQACNDHNMVLVHTNLRLFHH